MLLPPVFKLTEIRRHCRIRVIAGKVRGSPYKPATLSTDDRRRDTIDLYSSVRVFDLVAETTANAHRFMASGRSKYPPNAGRRLLSVAGAEHGGAEAGADCLERRVGRLSSYWPCRAIRR
jgi:hypothetical protein